MVPWLLCSTAIFSSIGCRNNFNLQGHMHKENDIPYSLPLPRSTQVYSMLHQQYKSVEIGKFSSKAGNL
jgi:hypothetical protein